MKQQRITKQHPDECRECEGIGYTAATSTEYVNGKQGYKTVKRGSACAICCGTGRLAWHQVVVTFNDGTRGVRGTGVVK